MFLIPIKAPQKHPVTVDYKEVEKEFKRALCFIGDSRESLQSHATIFYVMSLGA